MNANSVQARGQRHCRKCEIMIFPAGSPVTQEVEHGQVGSGRWSKNVYTVRYEAGINDDVGGCCNGCKGNEND